MGDFLERLWNGKSLGQLSFHRPFHTLPTQLAHDRGAASEFFIVFFV